MIRAILYLLLLLPGTIQADENPPLAVYINASTQDRNEAFQQLKQNIEHELDAAGIDHQLTDTMPDHNTPGLIIRYYDFEDSQTISIYPVTSLLYEKSPLLGESLTISANRPAAQAGELINLQVKTAVGLAHYTLGQCDEAEGYFQEAEMLADDSLGLDFYQGDCAILSEDWEAAQNYFETEINIFDEGLHHIPTPVTRLAWVHVQQNQPEIALDWMDRLVEASRCSQATATPNTPIPRTCESDALSRRARIHALLFNYNAAIDDIDAAIELDPENPALHVQRGQIVLLLYEWDRVKANYDRAIAIDPGYTPAYYHRGVLLYSVLEREAALENFERYLELDPQGEFAEQAATYAGSIRIELEALGTP